MYTIREFVHPQTVLERLMRLIIRLGRAGLVHGDFNEFNLMISPDEKITLIDFPQIVHLNHLNARELFDRDVRSVCEWFRKKCDLVVEKYPSFDEVLAECEADGGNVLANLNVQGMSKEDNDLLVAAHSGSKPEAELKRRERGGEDSSEEGESDDEDDDGAEEEDATTSKNEASTTAADTFEALVPEGGHEELGEMGDADGAEAEAPPNTTTTTVAEADASQEQDAAEDSDGDTSEEEEAPGQVTIANGRKTRKKQSAKEARKNLQRQQKTKPAKANNQKSRELRKARSEVKEYLS